MLSFLIPIPDWSHAFHGWFFLFDTVRMTLVLFSLWIAFEFLRLGVRLRNTRQYGCYCVSLVLMTVVWTEFEQLGKPPTVRLLISLVALIMGAKYVVGIKATELPALPHKYPHRRHYA